MVHGGTGVGRGYKQSGYKHARGGGRYQSNFSMLFLIVGSLDIWCCILVHEPVQKVPDSAWGWGGVGVCTLGFISPCFAHNRD